MRKAVGVVLAVAAAWLLLAGAYVWRNAGPSKDATSPSSPAEGKVAEQPRPEAARMAAAESLEQRDRLDEALQQYVALAIRDPRDEEVNVRLARLLRMAGRIDDARAVLEPWARKARPPREVAVAMAQIELESGNYAAAAQWLERAERHPAAVDAGSLAAAILFGLQGKTIESERLLERMDAANALAVRIGDLQARLATHPQDTQAAAEVQRLSQTAAARPREAEPPAAEGAGKDKPGNAVTPAAELYAMHCSGCHAASGDGRGRAAPHLFPKPRDLRTSGFRLVSTVNGVPTHGDCEAVIWRGMPGTSMRSYQDLSAEQRRLLAEEVLRLRREGIRDRCIRTLREEGEEIDEAVVRRIVDNLTTPGAVVHAPRIGLANAQAVARGREAFFNLGCSKCHAEDGASASDTPLFDDKGREVRPRDWIHEPFKGGHEPESIYVRIVVGMPGSPHPACPGAPEEQIIDLVHFCRSLSQEPKWVLTNHQRAIQASSRATLHRRG